MQLEPGSTVERYRIEELIGRGDKSVVYRVVHDRLGSVHALKILAVPSNAVKKRLLQQGRVQAQLRHPNLVSVSDVLDLQGAPGLVMDFIDGPSLELWLRANKPRLDEALALFRGIVRGLRAAHREGLVHRDLKPRNILLANRDESLVPKIADFALAKALEEDGSAANSLLGSQLGSAEYQAPEQVKGEGVIDQRTDLYALGVILYQLVTGAKPFEGVNDVEVWNKVLKGQYPPVESRNPHVPPEVARTIDKLLSVDPQDRPANCDQVLTMLYDQEASVVTTASAADATAAPQQREFGPTRPGRNSLLASALIGSGAALVVAIVLVGVALVAWQLTRPPEAKEVGLGSAIGGRVELTGDAAEVWLTGDDGARVELSAADNGSYTVHARFGSKTVEAGSLTLEKGQQATIKCSASYSTCIVKTR